MQIENFVLKLWNEQKKRSKTHLQMSKVNTRLRCFGSDECGVRSGLRCKLHYIYCFVATLSTTVRRDHDVTHRLSSVE